MKRKHKNNQSAMTEPSHHSTTKADRSTNLRAALSVLLLFLSSASLLLTGCSQRRDPTPAKLLVKGGNNQWGTLGQPLTTPIVVEVLGPLRKGVLGGKGTRAPVPDATVCFESADGPDSAVVTGADKVLTDAAGYARTEVCLGTRFGDQYVRATVLGYPHLAVQFRFIGGIEVWGHPQETVAGDKLPEPVRFKVTDSNQEPVAGVPVHFRLIKGAGKKGKLIPLQPVTDAGGFALVQLQTDPAASGEYHVLAEIADPRTGFHARGVVVTAMALNRTKLVVGVLGGLALFILGMKFMSEGLQKVAGSRLKKVLQFLARNRFTAVLAGTAVTALIQSSSACTVMVVGFVNAGLLTLHQAIGIIFGAAIGTTVTGQIVSFKLDGLALPAIAIAVTILLIARSSVTRNWAETLLGFGVLFLGMSMMSGELKAIAGFPSFVKFFSIFDCQPGPDGRLPLLAIIGAVAIGTLLTMVVQSSSATIGLTIALANSGLVNFYTAIPLILGDNIGTTITALLASIGTNRRAKQAAVAHTIFKVIGVIYMVLLLFVRVNGVPVFLWLVDQITAGNVFADNAENVGRHIAAAHTLFNVVNVVVFLPLIAMLVWMCHRLLPIKEDEKIQVQSLEPHLLNTPAVALGQVLKAFMDMNDAAWKLAEDCYSKLRKEKLGNADVLHEREAAIDTMQREITQYLVELTERQLSEKQAMAVPLLIHCVNDAERIGDHAQSLLELTAQMVSQESSFTRKAKTDLDGVFALLDDMAEAVRTVLTEGDEEQVARAIALRGELNRTVAQCHQNHMRRLGKGKCTVAGGVVFVEALVDLERIANHLSNIVERVLDIRRFCAEQ